MWRALTTCLVGVLAAAQGNIIVSSQDPPHTVRDVEELDSLNIYVMVKSLLIVEEFRDMPASFGPDIPIDGLRGFLVPGIPSDGCTALAKPPVVDNITGKWVVIVARYNCSFETKIRNAQAAGYDCAIVHNVNSSELETMSAKDPDGIDIPSVFVNELSGLILAEKYIFTEGFYIMVNGDLPFNISTHLLLPFAIVVVLCLIAILIFMIVKCIKDRRRARRHRLPNRALKKIPTCKFSKGDPYDTCAICLDDYQEGERLRVLPCAHAYHAKCIDPWLTQSRRVCPVCKRRVLAAGERRARSDSDSDTEPLVTSAPTDTQGGTFEEQRENPFVRAARYVARLRGRGADAQIAEENTVQPNNDENGGSAEEESERAPLVRVVSERSERAERAGRRGRRVRRGRARSAPRVRPALPSVNSHEPGEIGECECAPPVLNSAHGSARRQRRVLPALPSVNNDEPGEIGVAALPAPRPATTPNLMNL